MLQVRYILHVQLYHVKNYRASKGELPYIGVVHRLDQPVEGIMVFAKNKEAAADLSRQIKTKLADKYYYAMTDGVPEKKKGTLEDELLQNGKTNTSEVVERGTPQAKHASLSYEVVEQDGKHAVLRIKLDTGRHHQIRVQLAHAGMPIVGDKKYNFKENIAPSGGQLALCSFKIAFRHPKTDKKLEFEIMSMIPFGMIGYMKLTFGDFLKVLYGNPAGIIVMSICLALYFIRCKT